jgi:anti-sigma regulatory factor (Ser/Thr protein kinase)
MPGPDYEMLRQRCCMRSQVELRLPPEPIAPTLARAAVAAVGLPEAVASDIELLATEIVSNAVRHANLDPSEEIILRIVADGYVRVEVTDLGPPFEPKLRRLEPGPSGWGLFLVDTISTSWGVEAEGIGKKVWFELA